MNNSGYVAAFAAAVCLVTAGLAGCESQSGSAAQEAESEVDMSVVTRDLERVAQARILLGHQSVGRDVLAGVRTLASEAGVDLRVVAIEGVPPDDAPGLFHSHVGANGDPDSKCEAFRYLLDRPERPAYDVAMMKFCYVDLGRGTPLEVDAMLERYARLLGNLGDARPDVRIVHVTLPLRSDPPGWKTPVKRLLNREIVEDSDNALRNAFNDGLRRHYGSQPMFDLAAVESTLPDGSRSAFSLNGATVHTLADEYTFDGGHLNELGQRRAAAAFLATLSAALPEAAPAEL